MHCPVLFKTFYLPILCVGMAFTVHGQNITNKQIGVLSVRAHPFKVQLADYRT